MKPRQDLLELSLTALTAIANAGFVKRAQKDLAAGAGPVLHIDEDNCVNAEFADATLTRFAPGQTLAEADCNCNASGMCRHRVMLVLAYQAHYQATSEMATAEPGAASAGDSGYWNPAEFSDSQIQACFSASTLRQAELQTGQACQARLYPARLQADGKSYSDPAVQLASNHVRFFSRSSPAHARCDCQQASACSHIVLALWAYRQASRQFGTNTLAEANTALYLEVQAQGEPAPSAASSDQQLLTSQAAKQARADLNHFLYTIWSQGSGQNLQVLEISYQKLLSQLQALQWTWPELNLQAIWQQLLAQAARSSRYQPLQLLSLISQSVNRLSAAEFLLSQAQPALPLRQILGIGQAGAVELDSLRLVCLGAEFWHDQQQLGASLVFADTDTQVISVLEKSWPLAADESPDAALILNKRIANFPVRQLAAGQIISKAAKRAANAQLELSSQQRLSSILPQSAKAWDDLREPLKWSDLAALRSYLQQGLPEFVRDFQAQTNYLVLEIGALELIDYHWLAAEQCLYINWQDQQGLQLQVSVYHHALTPDAVDQAARALNGEFGDMLAWAGPVQLLHGKLSLQARSLLCRDKMLNLALTSAPQTVRPAIPALPTTAAPGDNSKVLTQTRTELALLLRTGLLSSNHHARRRLHDQIQRLKQQAYHQSAQKLQQLSDSLSEAVEPARLVRSLAEFDALLSALEQQ